MIEGADISQNNLRSAYTQIGVNNMKINYFCMAILLLQACGDSNINQFFSSEAQDNMAVDYQLDMAERHYDLGNYSKALEFALKAEKINPNREETGLMLSYIYLSNAGIDTFKIAENMISATNTSGTQEASALLTDFGSIVGVTNSDIETNLSLESVVVKVNDQDYTVSQISAIDIFKDLPIVIPKTADSARLSASATVASLNLAVSKICPFIESSIVDNTDSRQATCGSFAGTRTAIAKSRWVWMLAHLGEAIAFNAVISYTPDSTSLVAPSSNTPTSNIIARGNALNKYQGNISGFAAAINDYSAALEAIMPTETGTEGNTSMIQAMFDDLDAVNKALSEKDENGNILIPTSLSKGITNSITSLKTRTSSITANAAAGQSTEAIGMKDNLTKKINTTLEAKVESEIAGESGSDKQEACDAFDEINTDPSLSPDGC